MKRSTLNKQAIIAAIFGFGALGSVDQARAQEVPKTLSPLRYDADINDVNIANGKTSNRGPVLSVPAAPNLVFDIIQNAAPYLVDRIGNSQGVRTDSISIHYGADQSASFTCRDYDCYDVSGGGSLMVAPTSFTRAPDGALYNFNLVHSRTVVEEKRYASSVTFPNGEKISYTYSTGSFSSNSRVFYRPSKISSNLGYYITIKYQADGPDASVTGWSVVTQAELYSLADPATPLGRLTYSGTSITDIAGRVYQCSGCNTSLGAFIPSTNGSLTLPGDSVAARTVAPLATNNNVIGSVTRDGAVYAYAYQNLRLVGSTQAYDGLTVSGPEGYTASYKFSLDSVSALNVLGEASDALNRKTLVTRDQYQRILMLTRPEGDSTSVTYINGMVASTTNTAKPSSDLANQLANRIEKLNYNLTCDGVACWRPDWYQDANGNQTDYVYNTNGQLTEQTDPADKSGVRRKTINEYTVTNGLSRRTVTRVCGAGTTCDTPNEIRTEYSYWNNTFLPSQERKIDAATGITLTTDFTYDAAGRLLAIDGPLTGAGDAKYFRYDLIGRKTWEIGAANAAGVRLATRYTYRDSDDKVVATEAGTVPNPTSIVLTVYQRSDIRYDARRNRSRVTISAGGTAYTVTDESYDLLNRLQCTAVRMDPAQWNTQTDACVPQLTGPNGPDRITRLTYDAASQLVRREVAVGTADQADEERWTYTLNGKRESVLDGNGNKTKYEYDGHDRLSDLFLPSPTTPGIENRDDYEHYTYDAAGNRTALKKRDGRTISYTYDALNRLRVKNPSGMAPVYYDYDMQNQLLYARFGSDTGQGITNDYDRLGRMISTIDNVAGTPLRLDRKFDVAGNRERLTWTSNGEEADGVYAAYAFDPANRMRTVKLGTAALATLTYDTQGRRTKLTFAGGGAGSMAYGYDAIGRMNKLTLTPKVVASKIVFDYRYNPASQMISTASSNDSYAFNDPIPAGNYTTNGLNQYKMTGQGAIEYDSNGNLRYASGKTYGYDTENRLTGSGAVALNYDPLGRLASIVNGATTTRFLYDGDALVGEYDSSGRMTRRYIHGAGVDEPLAVISDPTLPGKAQQNLFADHHGSIVAVSTAADTAINRYDAFGIPGAANTGRFAYTGQIFIPELGLYHYKARAYAPGIGRFMQTDPLGYDDGVNWYNYVANDPVNGVDPTGESITVSCSVEEGKVTSCTASQKDDGIDKVFLRTKTTNSDGSISTRTSVIGKESDLTSGRDLANNVESAFKQLYNVDLTMTVGTAAAAAGSVRGSSSSAGNMQQQVERGQAPREIDRVDKGRGPYEKDHIELKDGRALNRDGTWKHGSGQVNNSVRNWLVQNGWTPPR